VCRYRYKFIVDGVWLTDTSAPIEQDEQGFDNNILVVNTAQVPVPFMPVLLGISQKSYEF
jgi:hypothetical protein